MTPWREFKKEKSYPKLSTDIAADVAIIGGGMTGILCAYRLSREGYKVALIEKEKIGSYATMDTTAFITSIVDTGAAELSSIFDEQAARLVWKSGERAIGEFEKTISKEKIDCEFARCPNFVYASDQEQLKGIAEDFHFYKRWKADASLETSGETLGFENFGYMRMNGQAKFHPTKFLYKLSEIASESGVEIFEHTEALSISGKKPVVIRTSGGAISARDVIIATYKPLTSQKTYLKKAMYRSYVYEAEIPAGIFKEALYEDHGNPYFYFRVDPGDKFDRMIIGGADHKDIFGKTLKKESFQAVSVYLSRIMGEHHYRIVRDWNGPILEPSDGLPLIGRIKPHHYVATAFSGNGMTYAMTASILLTDMVNGARNPLIRVYDPKRTILHPKRLGMKARDYLEEFFKGAVKNILSD